MTVRLLGISIVAILVLAAIGFADKICVSDRSAHETRTVRTLVRSGASDALPVRLTSSAGDAAPLRDEVMIDERFEVRPGERLLVRNVHSDVQIETGAGSEAHIRVILSGRSSDRARAFFEHLNFRVDKRGNTVEVVTEPRGSWNGSSGGAEIDVRIRVPSAFDAEVRTRHGDVAVGDLKGALSFDVAHGDLGLGDLSGSSLNIAAAHGDVAAGRLASEKSRIDVQHGDVDIEEITAMEIRFDVQHGDLDLRDITASNVTIATAHGDVEIARLDGYPDIRTSHGNVAVRLANARGGAFNAHHGDIDIYAPPASGMDVDLAAPDIDIDSEYGFQGRQDRERIAGRVSGGGPKLAAKSTHGHVRLHAANPH